MLRKTEDSHIHTLRNPSLAAFLQDCFHDVAQVFLQLHFLPHVPYTHTRRALYRSPHSPRHFSLPCLCLCHYLSPECSTLPWPLSKMLLVSWRVQCCIPPAPPLGYFCTYHMHLLSHHNGWKLFIYTSFSHPGCELLEARASSSISASLLLLTQRPVCGLCSATLCWIPLSCRPCHIRWEAQQKWTEAYIFKKQKKEAVIWDNQHSDS